ncbi:tetratricopeptide repeat protein [candidate division KSB1 bacterium]|nr:tetratricopeptide repeat protein [candidate division KSB1 bacterium]MBL7092362.1 tetratricopeptide repeat protein [candidate division KSB1 bacterium]
MTKLSRNIIIFSITIILTLIANFQANANHNQHVFEQANELYQQEKFGEAITQYLEIINNGYENWQLYFNLGNSYYRTGQFGRSILNFERAYRLNPKNEDVVFNLHLVNTKVVDNIKTPPLTEFINDVKNVLSKTALIWLTITAYLGLAALIILKMFLSKRRIQRLLQIILIPVVIVLLLATSILILRINENTSVKYAIVLTDKVDVLGEPSDSGTELFSLHEGAKFKIEEYSGGWAKIRLSDGNVGWLKKDVFEII